MAFDAVPWFVGGGAQHSPDVARTLAFAAVSGNEGIIHAGSMGVTQLDVPGTQVQVAPGACAIKKINTGIGSTQMYIARAPEATAVDIAATGSSGGRSDLIVARVEDPFIAGSPYQPPADVTAGPYVFPRVISGVPAGTQRLQDVPGHENDSALTLARVDVPASTGTITNAMIIDLRQMAIPISQRIIRTYSLPTSTSEQLTATSAAPDGGAYWPSALQTAWDPIWVPDWATIAVITMTWAGVLFGPGNTWGDVWVQFGATSSQGGAVYTNATRFDAPKNSGNTRYTVVVADTVKIPVEFRGNKRHFYPKGTIQAGSAGDAGARPVLMDGSAMILDIEFQEAPE